MRLPATVVPGEFEFATALAVGRANFDVGAVLGLTVTVFLVTAVGFADSGDLGFSETFDADVFGEE